MILSKWFKTSKNQKLWEQPCSGWIKVSTMGRISILIKQGLGFSTSETSTRRSLFNRVINNIRTFSRRATRITRIWSSFKVQSTSQPPKSWLMFQMTSWGRAANMSQVWGSAEGLTTAAELPIFSSRHNHSDLWPKKYTFWAPLVAKMGKANFSQRSLMLKKLTMTCTKKRAIPRDAWPLLKTRNHLKRPLFAILMQATTTLLKISLKSWKSQNFRTANSFSPLRSIATRIKKYFKKPLGLLKRTTSNFATQLTASPWLKTIKSKS